jgi:hypothetical protein
MRPVQQSCRATAGVLRQETGETLVCAYVCVCKANHTFNSLMCSTHLLIRHSAPSGAQDQILFTSESPTSAVMSWVCVKYTHLSVHIL